MKLVRLSPKLFEETKRLRDNEKLSFREIASRLGHEYPMVLMAYRSKPGESVRAIRARPKAPPHALLSKIMRYRDIDGMSFTKIASMLEMKYSKVVGVYREGRERR